MGPSMRETISSILSRAIEPSDEREGFAIIQSLAGGTGSGVGWRNVFLRNNPSGCFVNEVLADEYPSAFRLNFAIAPHDSGEVVVDAYNSIFTLASLSQAPPPSPLS
jgi:tubulin delta